jgi:glycosyltransferase involved in cell wall biosynthesis
MKNKTIAIVHDYIKEYGGAERVLETLHETFPDAPIFTLIYAPQFLGPHRERFKKWNIKTSFLQHIPFSYKLISIYRLIAPFVFQFFDFSNFDIILVSATGAYQPNVIHKKKAKQICYCHTPPRYLYGYKTAREVSKNPIVRIITACIVHILRMVDVASSKHVDIYIANSYTVAERIKKFYRKDAKVIYPPVDIAITSNQKRQRKDFLTGGRLARPKHIDILIKACNKLQVVLKIFGKEFSGYGEELFHLAGPTIEFLGEVSDKEKNILLEQATAFLFASEDEDFGITPVEAMAAGTPVIAYKSGGVMESVIDGKTGIFFKTLTIDSVTEAIQRFQKIKINPEDCKKQAKKFKKEQFKKEIQNLINSL